MAEVGEEGKNVGEKMLEKMLDKKCWNNFDGDIHEFNIS
jgi:hypothetical protein